VIEEDAGRRTFFGWPYSDREGPGVRISLPPGKSLRTIGSCVPTLAIAASKSRPAKAPASAIVVAFKGMDDPVSHFDCNNLGVGITTTGTPR
jgi:hypothetical protein